MNGPQSATQTTMCTAIPRPVAASSVPKVDAHLLISHCLRTSASGHVCTLFDGRVVITAANIFGALPVS